MASSVMNTSHWMEVHLGYKGEVAPLLGAVADFIQHAKGSSIVVFTGFNHQFFLREQIGFELVFVPLHLKVVSISAARGH